MWCQVSGRAQRVDRAWSYVVEHVPRRVLDCLLYHSCGDWARALADDTEAEPRREREAVERTAVAHPLEKVLCDDAERDADAAHHGVVDALLGGRPSDVTQPVGLHRCPDCADAHGPDLCHSQAAEARPVAEKDERVGERVRHQQREWLALCHSLSDCGESLPASLVRAGLGYGERHRRLRDGTGHREEEAEVTAPEDRVRGRRGPVIDIGADQREEERADGARQAHVLGTDPRAQLRALAEDVCPRGRLARARERAEDTPAEDARDDVVVQRRHEHRAGVVGDRGQAVRRAAPTQAICQRRPTITSSWRVACVLT